MNCPESAARILVVDDEPKVGATLKKVLETAGYQVEVAYNGQEGWDRFEQFHPDCIILDLRMPGINGYELLQRFKSVPKAPHVIIATAMANETLMHLCRKAGAAYLILKPVNLAKLIERIQNLLAPTPLSDTAPSLPFRPHGNN